MFEKTKIERIAAKNVIQKKLFFCFLISALLMSLMSLFTYSTTRLVLAKVDTIFTNDRHLTDLSQQVDLVESSLKNYLSSGGSEDLEDYLVSSYNLHNSVSNFQVNLTDLADTQRIVEGQQLMTTYKPISQLAQQAALFAYSMATGKPTTFKATINDGTNNVPYYSLTPIAVSKENMLDTIIKDKFHSMADVYRNVPLAQWPTQNP